MKNLLPWFAAEWFSTAHYIIPLDRFRGFSVETHKQFRGIGGSGAAFFVEKSILVALPDDQMVALLRYSTTTNTSLEQNLQEAVQDFIDAVIPVRLEAHFAKEIVSERALVAVAS